MEELLLAESARLKKDVEWALRRAVDPGDVLPMLHRLARTAPSGSDESVFAFRHLAELVAPRHPWRAALYARRAIEARPSDDRSWAVLALCQTLLGNYRFACSAYHRALSCAPANPWYAHNLGHLLDVALDRAGDALDWLKMAYVGSRGNGEIAASYAHALARAGKADEARRVLMKAMKRGGSREHVALWRWLDGSARPVDGGSRANRPVCVRAAAAAPGGRSPSPVSCKRFAKQVDEALARGLKNLPFNAEQCERARTLASDAARVFGDRRTHGETTENVVAQSIAAAIAYAIVYVDHMPLTQTEVASPFRVSVARLRGRFGQLKSELALCPGDGRYASSDARSR